MYKGMIVALLILTVALAGLLACESEEETKPAEVILDDLYPLSGNATDVVIQGDFKVKNPNDEQVVLDSFEYVVAVEDKDVGYVQFGDDRNLTASEEISLSGTAVVSFGNLVGDAMLSHGLSQTEALETILPYWKKMGGQNPVAPMQELWDSIDPGVTFTASGSAYIEVGDQRVTTNFTESITR